MNTDIQGVIFDFNGTLFLDNDKHVKAWSRISRELRGRDITEDELQTYMNGRPNKAIVAYLSRNQISDEEAEQLSLKKEQYYREYCQEDTEHFHLIQGAAELFSELKKREIPFTIASASIKPNIDFFVRSFHLDQWIRPEDIVYDDGTYADKTEMFRKAAAILQVPVENITVIEDSLAGVEASLACGIQDIRIMNSGHIASQVKAFPQVRQICNTMNDIVL